jgi:hypothetical protein
VIEPIETEAVPTAFPRPGSLRNPSLAEPGWDE